MFLLVVNRSIGLVLYNGFVSGSAVWPFIVQWRFQRLQFGVQRDDSQICKWGEGVAARVSLLLCHKRMYISKVHTDILFMSL